MESDKELQSEIAWWIHRLPRANIMLIYVLIRFLRKISRRRSSLKFNWNNLAAVITYFGPSLFVRPYQPGFANKADALYFSLLCYMMVHWSRIRRKEHDCFKQLEDKLCPIWEQEESDDNRKRDYSEYRLLECGCQTSDWLLLATSEEGNDDIAEEEHHEFLSGHKLEPQNLSSANVSEHNEEDEKEVKEEDEEEKEEVEVKASLQTLEVISEMNENRSKLDSRTCHSDASIYEEIPEDDINSNSETVIYKKNSKMILTPDIIKKKLVKANITLVNVISKVNVKLKSKQEILKSRSGSNVEHVKYNLLKDPGVKKVHSLQANHIVKESPNITYKKLMTL